MEYDFEPGDFVYLTSRGNMPALIVSVIDEFYDDPKLYQAIGIGSRKYRFFTALHSDEMKYAGKHINLSDVLRL